jgi:hypothetical protein
MYCFQILNFHCIGTPEYMPRDVLIQPTIVTVKTEEARTSGMLVSFYQTAQHNTPEDSRLHTYHHEEPQISFMFDDAILVRLYTNAK